jgi:hypothetical protein
VTVGEENCENDQAERHGDDELDYTIKITARCAIIDPSHAKDRDQSSDQEHYSAKSDGLLAVR